MTTVMSNTLFDIVSEIHERLQQQIDEGVVRWEVLDTGGAAPVPCGVVFRYEFVWNNHKYIWKHAFSAIELLCCPDPIWVAEWLADSWLHDAKAVK